MSPKAGIPTLLYLRRRARIREQEEAARGTEPQIKRKTRVGFPETPLLHMRYGKTTAPSTSSRHSLGTSEGSVPPGIIPEERRRRNFRRGRLWNSIRSPLSIENRGNSFPFAEPQYGRRWVEERINMQEEDRHHRGPRGRTLQIGTKMPLQSISLVLKFNQSAIEIHFVKIRTAACQNSGTTRVQELDRSFVEIPNSR